MFQNASNSDQTVIGKINFLSRSPIYDTVKPYTLRYRPAGDISQTNVERTLHEVKLHDMRKEKGLSYDKDGFIMASMESCLQYEDYEDAKMVEDVHQKEVMDVVRTALDAKSVEVLDYVVRLFLHNYHRELKLNGNRFEEEIQHGLSPQVRRMYRNNLHQRLT